MPTGAEWLTWWSYIIQEMGSVAREGTLVELAAVPGVDEELDRAPL
jgi:hypothetical protein